MLSPPHCHLGGRPQAASLVQGLRPRNAPLQNHRSPTVCARSNGVASATWLPPTEYAFRLPEWRQRLRAGQNRYCIWLSSYASPQNGPPLSGDEAPSLFPSLRDQSVSLQICIQFLPLKAAHPPARQLPHVPNQSVSDRRQRALACTNATSLVLPVGDTFQPGSIRCRATQTRECPTKSSDLVRFTRCLTCYKRGVDSSVRGSEQIGCADFYNKDAPGYQQTNREIPAAACAALLNSLPALGCRRSRPEPDENLPQMQKRCTGISTTVRYLSHPSQASQFISFNMGQR